MFIVSATTPFTADDHEALGRDAAAVIWNRFPESRYIFAELGWSVFPTLDRVYVNARARSELNWQPRDVVFEEGPYPV
jgi:UDP-glucose 4-epimerase